MSIGNNFSYSINSEIEKFSMQIIKKLEKKGVSADKIDEKKIKACVKQALDEIEKSNIENTKQETVAIYTEGGKEYRARITQSKMGERKLIILKRNINSPILNAGSYGKILKFKKMHSVGDRIIKQARFKNDDSLENEFYMQKLFAADHVQKPGKNLIKNKDGYIEYDAHFYSGGSLENFIKTLPTPLPSKDLRNFMKMMVMGMRELHERGIGHFDIKPDNFLVEIDENGKPKIVLSDLGGAYEFLDPKSFDIFTPLYSLGCDRQSFSCPDDEEEFVKNQKKRDVYSLGLTAFQIATKTSREELVALFEEMERNRIMDHESIIVLDLAFNNVFKQKMEDKKVEEKDVRLILKMIHPFIGTRISSEKLATQIGLVRKVGH